MCLLVDGDATNAYRIRTSAKQDYFYRANLRRRALVLRLRQVECVCFIGDDRRLKILL
jgi:hypothetical protein